MVEFIDLFLHLDEYLKVIVQEYATLTYIILFAVIFIETGLVVMPFLPGDSLLFAAGALASLKALSFWPVFIVILAAAILGDTVNYHLGKFLGPKIFYKKYSFLFNKEYLARAELFYKKHGAKTIILARFIPIIRTFAPFVAGIGTMNYTKFLRYNILGAMLWVVLFVLGGYLFGNIPFVQDNFNLVVLAIIIISFIPAITPTIKRFFASKRK